MARKKVREYDAKRMLKASLARLTGLDLPLKAVQVCVRVRVSESVRARVGSEMGGVPWTERAPSGRPAPDTPAPLPLPTRP
jgi:hypothetical protein